MGVLVGNVVYDMVSSAIYDAAKYGISYTMTNGRRLKKDKIEDYVRKNLDNKYAELSDIGVFETYMHNPQVKDIINNYLIFIITGECGEFRGKIEDEREKCVKNINEEDIVSYLTNGFLKLCNESGAVNVPDKGIVSDFFRSVFNTGRKYILSNMDAKCKAEVYLINHRIDLMEIEALAKLDEITKILNSNIKEDIISEEKTFEENKKDYMNALKNYHKVAHIYLLDKFDIEQFYVPPVFVKQYKDSRANYRMNFAVEEQIRVMYGIEPQTHSKSEEWKHIFDKSNIIYVIGGAGYGKSLFMKNLIVEHEKLNILDAKEHLVIYGELKNFFLDKSNEPLPVEDFLLKSMETQTLIGDEKLSKKMIEYYLNRGRCIILLDALDEVEKEKRKELHGRVVNYFRSKNLNNKVCITSRARGFVPEKNVEIYEIKPLDLKQITTYVDNIIALGKFDIKDREAFLEQTKILVEKGFLNSFLVLSLLINIYKAERELPENKLELYQKCFEYISNRREKEKSQDKYDWNLISTMMKDNTFMELSNLCLPNNSDVSKTKIKEKLTQIYKTKYLSENQTENAVDQFLAFCSDRTELFVPASKEDCYKFFHRSFFEYFYSQYIFTRMSSPIDIYNAWRKFDVDSEVFELTLATFKQKYEPKYKELVEFVMGMLSDASLPDEGKIGATNIFVLCLKVIDDEVYKNDFVRFLVEQAQFCQNNIRHIHNQEIIYNLICSKDEYASRIVDAYGERAKSEKVVMILELIPMARDFVRENMDRNKDERTFNNTMEQGKKYFEVKVCSPAFYSRIVYEKSDTYNLECLNAENIGETMNFLGKSDREKRRLMSRYRKYCDMDTETKKYVDELLLS